MLPGEVLWRNQLIKLEPFCTLVEEHWNPSMWCNSPAQEMCYENGGLWIVCVCGYIYAKICPGLLCVFWIRLWVLSSLIIMIDKVIRSLTWTSLSSFSEAGLLPTASHGRARLLQLSQDCLLVICLFWYEFSDHEQVLVESADSRE